MRGSLILFTGLMLIIGLGTSACAPLAKDDPTNPSYRLVSNQILQMDSALGTRGGLASLTRTSAPQSAPPRMSHGASVEPAPPRGTEQIKLNWALIARRVSTIEVAWDDLRLELERRQSEQVSESWNTGYNRYYQIMATKHYFESSLDYVKAYVAQKDVENIELAVILLTDAYIQVKDELKVTETDSRRLAYVLGGFVVVLAALTVTASIAARRRDRELVRLRYGSQPKQPSQN